VTLTDQLWNNNVSNGIKALMKWRMLCIHGSSRQQCGSAIGSIRRLMKAYVVADDNLAASQ